MTSLNTVAADKNQPVTAQNESIKAIAAEYKADPQKLADGVNNLRAALKEPNPDGIDKAVTEIAEVLSGAGAAPAAPARDAVLPAAGTATKYNNNHNEGAQGAGNHGGGSHAARGSAGPAQVAKPPADIDRRKLDFLRENLTKLGIPPDQIEKILAQMEAKMRAELAAQQAAWEAAQAAMAQKPKIEPVINTQASKTPTASDDSITLANKKSVSFKSKGGALAGSTESIGFENKKLQDEIARLKQFDPARAQKLEEISKVPVANWFSNGMRDESAVKEYMASAEASGKKALITTYSIPQRDFGHFYSAGGVANRDEYLKTMNMMSNSIGNSKADVHLEPDSLMDSYRMPPEQGAARRALLSEAVDTFGKNPNAKIHLSAGAPGWPESVPQDQQISKVVDGMLEAGLAKAGSFTVGESSYVTTPKLLEYGNAIVKEAESRGIKGLTFKLDTSRNGADVSHNQGEMSWAEAPGAALGYRSIADFKASGEYAALMSGPNAAKYALDNVSEFFSNKVTTEADGRIAPAGSFIPDFAIQMYDKAIQLGIWQAPG